MIRLFIVIMIQQDYNRLRSLIESAMALLKEININYNSMVGPRTKKLVELSNQIIPIIKEEYPEIVDILENATIKIINRQITNQPPFGQVVVNDFINAYAFGDLRTTLKILNVLFPPKTGYERKIFISHSSKDEIIVNAFIEKILMLGCGFMRSDIFCTLDHAAIRTGHDFRSEIIFNMANCDFVIFMISDNFRASEVCQNELGAAWALPSKRLLPFKFPNVSFSNVGFLNEIKQVADIVDKPKLDELYDELCNYYSIKQDWHNFNKQKDVFVDLVNKIE